MFKRRTLLNMLAEKMCLLVMVRLINVAKFYLIKSRISCLM